MALPTTSRELYLLLLQEINRSCSATDISHGAYVMRVAMDVLDSPLYLSNRHRALCERYLYLLGIAADVEGTLALLAHMQERGIPATESVCSSAITTLAKSGRFAEARAILDGLIQGDDGASPAARSFTSLMEAHALAGDVPGAVEVLRLMEAHDCRRRLGDTGHETLDRCTAAVIDAAAAAADPSMHAANVWKVIHSFRAVGEGLPPETFQAAQRWYAGIAVQS